MSVLPTAATQQHFDPDELTSWWREHHPAGPVGKVKGLRPASESAGWSNRTWLIDLEEMRGGDASPTTLVVRAGPAEPGQGYFATSSVARQFSILHELGRQTSLPVPRVRFYDPVGGPIGAECFVMERIEGQIPGDAPPFLVEGFVAAAREDERERLWRSTIDAVAEVGRLAGEHIVLDADPSRSGRTELDRWLAHYVWARSDQADPVVEIDEIIDWLQAHVPAQVGNRLVWGDARFANVVYRDFSVAGLLDWELADVGDPTNDLAYFLVLQRMAEAGMGARQHARPRPSGFWSERRTVEHHAAVTGCEPEHLRYYWVLSLFKLIAMMQRMASLLERAGLSSPPSAERRRRSALLVQWAQEAIGDDHYLDARGIR